MLCAQHLAGFDERGANALRKILGKSDTGERLRQHEAAFRAGCDQRGVPRSVVDLVWGMISSFAGYSFTKAHSASYAMVSFQCAWLKAHFAAHFMARVVANEGGFYDPGAYLAEARRLGIRVLRPCLIASEWKTARATPTSIRCGLHLVRGGLSQALVERVVAERARRPFTGLVDLVRRTRMPGRVLLTLAHIGALEAVRPDLHHAQLCWLAEAVALAPPRPATAGDGEQALCIADTGAVDPLVLDLPVASAPSAAWDRFRTLGFLPEGHAMHFCTPPPERTPARDLAQLPAGTRIVVTAIAITRKQVEARTGQGAARMAFVTLEDETGLIESTWFPEPDRSCGMQLDRGLPLRVEGVVEFDHGVASLVVERAEPWPWAHEQVHSGAA
jgi:DNA polymerase-3 subunit alpha/error-prone DNA polymerase